MMLTRDFLQDLTLPQLDIVAYFIDLHIFFCDKEYAINKLIGAEITPLTMEIMLAMLDDVKK